MFMIVTVKMRQWNVVLEKKLTNGNYTFSTDFPPSEKADENFSGFHCIRNG
jgi:hypothetical protein